MAAENLLRNPGLFAGHDRTSIDCVDDFRKIASPMPFIGPDDGDKGHNLKVDVFRKHMTEMINGSGILGKRHHRMKVFNMMRECDEISNWLDDFINDVKNEKTLPNLSNNDDGDKDNDDDEGEGVEK